MVENEKEDLLPIGFMLLRLGVIQGRKQALQHDVVIDKAFFI